MFPKNQVLNLLILIAPLLIIVNSLSASVLIQQLEHWPLDEAYNQAQQQQQQQQQEVVNFVEFEGRTGFVGKLSQLAPYAIESSSNGQNVKNIVFRLAALNQTNSSNNSNNNSSSKEQTLDDDPWTFVTKNGTLIGSKANLNLKKLLETLDNNNFTSEVKFDENDTGIVNITISNLRDTDKIDNLLLEELIIDAASGSASDNSSRRTLLNGSSILKDNHRNETPRNHQIRSKPTTLEMITITSPPLRGSVEIVAENYTVRKIAEEANNFAIKLLHQLNLEKLGNRNLIQAPFTVYQGLALLLTGAMGETAKEMDKALLGSQSAYENTRLTHDPDRPRLLASLSEVIRQLQYSATHHMRLSANETERRVATSGPYLGGTSDQHLIVANNLLFSPSAYEISPEFKSSLNTYFNNTALTKIEIGSTESIQVVNSWIRGATAGVIPSVLHKKNTFDEFNVMALLCTSWLSQEWRDTFYRISSPLRTSIRLKGQARAIGSFRGGQDFNLLEFVDDNKRSHFVDYIKSRPTTNIHHYHSVLNGLVVDVVVVPFKDSNHRLITLTPISSSSNNATQQLSEALIGQLGTASAQVLLSTAAILNQTTGSGGVGSGSGQANAELLLDSSLLSRLIGAFVSNSRKTMRSLWNIISPEIITKQTLQQNLAQPSRMNDSVDERILEVAEPPLVQLSMPILRTEADSSISAALNHIGIVNSFDPDQANFIGINGHPFNYYKLHLSNVISKTTFNLNERGINYDKTIKTLESLRVFPDRQTNEQNKASITLDPNNIKPELIDDVKLNKPFMYFICDIKTKLILYTGVLRNPEQEGP